MVCMVILSRWNQNPNMVKNNPSTLHTLHDRQPPLSREACKLEVWTDEKWRKEREDWRALVGNWKNHKPPRYIAIHEAGHAIAACRFRRGFLFVKLNPGSGASVPRNYQPRERDYKLRRAIGLMAGAFAEARYLRKNAFDRLARYDDGGDLTAARRLLMTSGVTLKDLATHYVRPCIRDYWPAINAIADLLQDRGFIEFDDPDVLAITSTISRLPEAIRSS